MATFTKLEIDRDGDLMQSSKIVPPSGELPRLQNTEEDWRQAKAYTQTIAPFTVLAAITKPDGKQKVSSIYAPSPLEGSALLRLLGPLLVVTIFFVEMYTFITTESQVHTLTFIISTIVISAALYLIVLYPTFLWARHLYFRGGPTPKVLTQFQLKYPHIRVHRNLEAFLLDASEN